MNAMDLLEKFGFARPAGTAPKPPPPWPLDTRKDGVPHDGRGSAEAAVEAERARRLAVRAAWEKGHPGARPPWA